MPNLSLAKIGNPKNGYDRISAKSPSKAKPKQTDFQSKF
jgi:hypothetical protein